MARVETTTTAKFEHWPSRSLELKPQELVEGWPTDKWEGYRHHEHPEQLERALALVRPLVEEWLRGRRVDVPGFLFFGAVGRGKTAVALALALYAARRGCSAMFTTAESVTQERNSTEYSKRDGVTQHELKQKYLAPLFLILDDVCARQYTPSERAFFLDIHRDRQAKGRLTLDTTNLELNFNTGTSEKPVFPQRALFDQWLDGRVRSTYVGWSFDANKWGPSLRGRDDNNKAGQ